MIGTSGSLPDGGPPTGSGAHGDCPFFAMSQAQALASAAEGKEQEPQEHADDAPANVTGSTSNNNNATSANEKPPLSMRSAVTVMSAVRKLKALSHDSADSNGQAGGSRSDGATKSNRREAPAYVRAAAASDARRLSALLGGRGLRELEEIQESSRRLIVVDHDRNAKTKKAVATTIKEGGEAKGDENNNGVLSAYEGPYPKSVPIPANSANADAVTSSNSGIVANGHGAATTWGWDLTARGGPDDRDVGTPDAWIPRHWEMERLSGRHPFNAQPKTSILMEAGFVTPGHLHFTRNHGAVPRLGWDEHRIEVSVLAAFGSSSNKPATTATSSPPEKLVLKMDDLSSDPAARCLPATMTCIGNRRSEFNAIRRTIGFSWGTATAATSVFRGVPLRTVLLRAGVTANPDDWTGCHVEFVGADELPNKVGPGPFEDEPWGKKVNYGTSVPLGKAMDPARDMMLAFEANGEPIPPDHGYPCRVIIPGSTAARSVKWVCRINVRDRESHNLYHHHDNKIFPPHVLDLESSLDPEKRWWYRGEYIVHELNINSVIASPSHGEKIRINLDEGRPTIVRDESTDGVNDEKEEKKADADVALEKSEEVDSRDFIELSGYAYSGGGRKVTRVELSIDSGSNWDITDLIRAETPTSHDMHWCWIFWKARIPARLLLNAAEIWCRAWDETNNTQPTFPTWNLMGLGQNSVYRVKVHAANDGVISFEHPTQPGGEPGGWMKEPGGLPDSAGFGAIKSKEKEEEEARAAEEAAAASMQNSEKTNKVTKTFTLQEVKNHNTDEDVWIVVKNKVYDCTKYLEFHPGGSESITIYGGRDCTKDFAAVHSLGATKQLEQYYIGDIDEADIVAESTNSGSPNEDEFEDTDVLDDDDPILLTVSKNLDRLGQEYGIAEGAMDPPDAAIVADGWAAILKNEAAIGAIGEALLERWRLIVAMEGILKKEEEAQKIQESGANNKDLDEMEYALHHSGIDKEALSKFETALHGAKVNRQALSLVKKNQDPLAKCLGARLAISPSLLIGLLDDFVGSLYPTSKRIARYIQRDLDGLGLISGTVEDYVRVFNRCGLQPDHWVLFCQAFLWCLETHVPNLSKVAVEDLAKDNKEGAFASFVSQQVVRPIVTSLRDMRVQRHTDPSFRALRRWYRGLVSSPEARAIIGELFYKNLFASHPDFMDYFASTDMDHLVSLFVDQLGFTLDVDLSFGALESAWHDRCAQLDRLHKRVQIPINSYSAFGGSYLKILRPLFEDEVEKLRSVGKATDKIVTVEGLEDAFSTLYVEIMGEVSPAMLVQEKIVAEAEEFLMHASKELMLSDEQLNERLLEMKLLVGANDSYSHTQDEIQVGARIACRNSMCPYNGLLSQLDVWNKGNLVTYEAMSGAIIDHLATVAAESGKDRTRKRSILVLFGPREVFDMTGTRFWTPSFTEYAGYSQDDGKILGDPRNVELTAHLIKHGLWKAPEVKSAFDMLPVVLKIPGQRPYVVPVPDGMRKEVRIEHPTCAAIAELNIRWPAFTIASSLRLCIGGVTYPCCAFNRIFFRSEVIKGICSRDGLVKQWADSMGIPQSDRLREKRALLEMEEAILHSFAGQDAVILSDDTKEDLRLQHERNEIKAGRDRSGYAPSHRVARFEGSCHSWKVSEATDNISAGLNFYASNQPSSGAVGSAEGNIPVVVIAYGSETGTGEQAALRLGRALKLLRPTVITLNDVAGLNIVKEKNVTHFIAICSTFNRGEFPSNAKEFASTALPSMALEGVKIAVLALGSMDYPDFCRAGVKLDAMLKSAGGKPFIPYTKVDGSKGSEVEISDFLRIVPKIILPAYLKAAIRGTSSQEDTLLRNEVKWLEADDEGDADASISSEGMHSFVWSKYDSLLCIGNEELFVEGDIDSRSTRRITFELPTETKYESGDHVSVHPLNSNDMVVRFAMCFKDEITDAAVASDSCPSFEDAGDKESAVVMRQLQKCVEVVTFDGDENIGAQVAFKAPAKLSHVLQARVDLTLHEGQVCDLLAMSARAFNGNGDTASEVAAQNADKASKIEEYSSSVSSIHDKNKKSSALKAFLNEYPTIVDFLEEHSFLCQREQLGKLPPLKLADVLAILPRQQARYYSISSSPIVQPTTVSISVGVVHVTTSAGIAIHGVCSNYLARLRPTIDRASIAVKTSSFRGPENPDDPLIMVGPGTGLAPMMGFLQDRAQHLAAVDPKPDTCHLFFGCRTPKDRIYGKLVDEWEANNILRHHLALSRSSEMPKTYVQDLMKQIGNELCELLRSDTARVYICGDAKIANACFEVCVDVLREHGKMSRMSAVTQIKKLRSQKRWQYDLWGSVHQFTEIKEQEVKDRSHATATSSWLKSFQ